MEVGAAHQGHGAMKQEGETQSVAVFDPMKAVFTDCGFADDQADHAKSWSRLVVAEEMVPLVSQGTPMSKHLSHFLELCVKRLPETLSDRLLQSAVKMVRVCCGALETLLSPASFDKAGFQSVDELMRSKDGVKGLLRQTILNSKDYKKLEAEIRLSQLASLQYGPSVAKAQESLERAIQMKEVELKDLQPTCDNLPQWLEALRPGATKKVEAGLFECLDIYKTKVLGDEDKEREDGEGVEGFAKLLSTFYTRLSSIEAAKAALETKCVPNHISPKINKPAPKFNLLEVRVASHKPDKTCGIQINA